MSVGISTRDSPAGHGWRSPKIFVVTAISFAMFSGLFFFSKAVGKDDVEANVVIRRISIQLRSSNSTGHARRTDPADTQILISIILSMNALVSTGIATFIGHLADKTSKKNRLLVVSWAISVIGTLLSARPAKLLADTVGAKALGLRYMFAIAGFLLAQPFQGHCTRWCLIH
ncbi:MFS general substrate transporter [Penicillium antarcticum]|uniref:MFS general substrate transporter n=1 Tax=Penicillium antarcticum TaxID=416450 RepID=UPI0023A5361C|nr:MFS general substrate transporter [Penicillium antarcticum]KAJ5306937.1 MFS general substrate transporter [Penicillium antarcticum]